MGLELAEQIGAENVAMVMRFQTPGTAKFLRLQDSIFRNGDFGEIFERSVDRAV